MNFNIKKDSSVVLNLTSIDRTVQINFLIFHPHHFHNRQLIQFTNHAVSLSIRGYPLTSANLTILHPAKQTPLHEAAHKGNKQCVQELILHGADPHAKNDLERTPLLEACNQGIVGILDNIYL